MTGHYPVQVAVEVREGDRITFETQTRCGCTEALAHDYPHGDEAVDRG